MRRDDKKLYSVFGNGKLWNWNDKFECTFEKMSKVSKEYSKKCCLMFTCTTQIGHCSRSTHATKHEILFLGYPDEFDHI